jgi:hypothetical protein
MNGYGPTAVHPPYLTEKPSETASLPAKAAKFSSLEYHTDIHATLFLLTGIHPEFASIKLSCIKCGNDECLLHTLTRFYIKFSGHEDVQNLN